MKPYHEEAGVTIYHGDCREVLPALTRKWVETGRGGGHSKWHSGALVTDPPYGIAYKSGSPRAQLADSIQGDEDTSLRDWALKEMHFLPALVFGSWKIQRPARTHTRLIWDTKGALGMGDLSIPWKPSDQEIYVIGRGFRGRRESNVIRCAPVQSMAKNGRLHPHEKPVPLMRYHLERCPPGTIFDPFMGSGSTLRAAADLGRRAIGIEIEERYCEMAAKRLGQGVLAV
jgi:DNA modification methylase